MPNHLLLHAAESRRLEAFATRNRLMRPVVDRYVGGSGIEDAWRVTADLNARGIAVSLDLLGESVSDVEQSRLATQEYLNAIEAISGRAPGSTVSVKLSQLGIVIDQRQCTNSLITLLEAASRNRIQVEVDMEHSSVGRNILRIYKEVVSEFPDSRIAMQANMRQTPHDLLSFADVSPKIRLVKGAFDEPVSLALRTASEITAQYNYLVRWTLENLPDPAFGTHDDACINMIKRVASQLGRKKTEFEFQMLYGVRRTLQEELVQDGYRVRVYLPFGTQWYPYLMRRMAEKPANLLLFLRSLIGN